MIPARSQSRPFKTPDDAAGRAGTTASIPTKPGQTIRDVTTTHARCMARWLWDRRCAWHGDVAQPYTIVAQLCWRSLLCITLLLSIQVPVFASHCSFVQYSTSPVLFKGIGELYSSKDIAPNWSSDRTLLTYTHTHPNILQDAGNADYPGEAWRRNLCPGWPNDQDRQHLRLAGH